MKRVHFSLVQFNHSVMCDSLEPHRMQHARLPYPSPTPGACSNSHPSSQWCHPTISSSVIHLFLPSVFPSIRVFSNESVLLRWPKYWSFSFSISPSSEYSRPISFKIDWLDLLAVQRTLKSPLQCHSSKASILKCSTFFLYGLTSIHEKWKKKKISLSIWKFVCEEMFLLFNMLSRLVIAFLPRSNCLLILWLQSQSAVISEPKRMKSVTVSIVPPSICM